MPQAFDATDYEMIMTPNLVKNVLDKSKLGELVGHEKGSW